MELSSYEPTITPKVTVYSVPRLPRDCVSSSAPLHNRKSAIEQQPRNETRPSGCGFSRYTLQRRSRPHRGAIMDQTAPRCNGPAPEHVRVRATTVSAQAPAAAATGARSMHACASWPASLQRGHEQQRDCCNENERRDEGHGVQARVPHPLWQHVKQPLRLLVGVSSHRRHCLVRPPSRVDRSVVILICRRRGLCSVSICSTARSSPSRGKHHEHTTAGVLCIEHGDPPSSPHPVLPLTSTQSRVRHRLQFLL